MPENNDPYALKSYQFFTLPEELIAQHPSPQRDQSRLMIIKRDTGDISIHRFNEISEFLESGDRLILNNTKVIPARLIGRRETGGKAEIFLLRAINQKQWEVLAKPGRKLKQGDTVSFSDEFACKIIETLPNGNKVVDFSSVENFEEQLERCGQMPLPPYIHDHTDDSTRYQTVYAEHAGAVAAPTAGLHFTQPLLEKLANKGVKNTTVTLHVGLGTFRPVDVSDIREHPMHSERFHITEETARELNAEKTGRNICVGTTSCRSLEAASDANGKVHAGDYDTDIFIYPGYRFKNLDCLLTNFHLPGSTLLMLVGTLTGLDLLKEAYHMAIAEKMRFYSYGDAMLIL
jgi:S-adenosylmethionine:tRNA ribosyltransferase-isomerase